MRRTTVFLPEALVKRAQRYAARHDKTFAQVVREALADYLSPGGTMKSKLPTVAGRFASGHRDTSARVDELLWKDPHG